MHLVPEGSKYAYVQMCICANVCMFARMYVCMSYTCTYVHTYFCEFMYMYAYVCVCMFMHMYAYVCVCICVCMYMDVYVCVCMCRYVYAYVYECVCVGTWVCRSLSIYLSIYLSIHLSIYLSPSLYLSISLFLSMHLSMHSATYTGWWFSHPSEKSEFVNWDDDRNPIFLGKFKKWHVYIEWENII